MRRPLAALGLAGLAGAGLYASRRAIVGRALGLRPAEHAVAVTRDLPVAMPDGVTLYADHLRPKAPGSFPTILIRTPYGRPSEGGPLSLLLHGGARLFAERGYNVVIQGVRGRFRSGGVFEPFVNERDDGRATLDWIAAQPWFDGNLGMWGASYVGYTQWAVAADAPPYLRAIVPIVSASRPSQAFYPQGSFSYEFALRWAHLLTLSDRPGHGLDRATLARLVSPRAQAALRAAMAGGAFAEADAATLGEPVPYYQRWLDEPEQQAAYWRGVDHDRGLGRINAAVHLVAGWYDLFLPEQLADYNDLLAAGRSPCLTILPYAHGDLALRGASVREGLWWFDAHLKGRRELLERRAVRLALAGSREWHEMDFWPPPARSVRFHLHAEGRLAPEPARAGASQYSFDPRDPTPAIGGPAFNRLAGPRDQRPLEARPDVLTFTSAPLEADLDLIGHVRLELYARSSLAHCDFVGRLCVVEPDGRSLNVCEGMVRVAPGEPEAAPDGALRLEIALGASARRFKAGQRLRLHICSAAHPRLAVNSGDGRALREGATAGQIAHQSILHDDRHPSALVLPTVSAETRRAMAGDGPTERAERMATP